MAQKRALDTTNSEVAEPAAKRGRHDEPLKRVLFIGHPEEDAEIIGTYRYVYEETRDTNPRVLPTVIRALGEAEDEDEILTLLNWLTGQWKELGPPKTAPGSLRSLPRVALGSWRCGDSVREFVHVHKGPWTDIVEFGNSDEGSDEDDASEQTL